MDMGADAVLINSAIAHAAKPVLMAEAMQHAVLAGGSLSSPAHAEEAVCHRQFSFGRLSR